MLLGCISTLFLFIVIVYLINNYSFFKFENWSIKWSYLAFALKLISGISIWLIYSFYYTERINSDIFKYFDDAKIIFQATENELFLRWKIILGFQNDALIIERIRNTMFWSSPNEFLFNDNRTITRIHLILLHFSHGFYHFHTLFFSFLSLIGSFGMFHFFKRFSSISTPFLVIFLFLVPSVLLWCSAPLKETFLIFGLGVFLFSLVKLNRQFSVKNTILLIVALSCLISIKIYFLIALLPGIVFWLISNTKNQKALFIQFSVVSIVVLIISFSNQNQLINILSAKQTQFFDLLNKSGANSGIAIGRFNSLQEFIAITPKALFNIFIRPVFPPNWNPFSALAALEHLSLISMLLLPFLYFKKPSVGALRLFLFSCSFLLISGLIIGSTTPILGAIVRYKSPLIPFYLIAIFTFVDTNKLIQKFK